MVNYYYYGYCDLCKKPVDSKESPDPRFDTFFFPVKTLYPSKLPSYTYDTYRNKGFYKKGYALCDDCCKKIAEYLYNTYEMYYESQNH